MRCFICATNAITDERQCHTCRALLPIAEKMEYVHFERDGRFERDAMSPAFTLTHEPEVPFWVSESNLNLRVENCTVVEVKAHNVKVLLVIEDGGNVLVSAYPVHMPFSRVVTRWLFGAVGGLGA